MENLLINFLLVKVILFRVYSSPYSFFQYFKPEFLRLIVVQQLVKLDITKLYPLPNRGCKSSKVNATDAVISDRQIKLVTRRTHSRRS